MNNFWQRALTGTVFVAVLVGAILLGGWYMHITFGVVVLLGLLEFYKLFENSEAQPQRILGAIIGTSLYFVVIMAQISRGHLFEIITFGILICALITVSIFELFRKKEKPFNNIALTVIGILYVALPFILLNLLAYNRHPEPLVLDGAGVYNLIWPVLGIFILVWCNDTFAYLTGRLIGKHKLFERISPKKTWEGFIGGVIFAVIAGIILAYFLEESYAKYITYALVAGIIGTLGDLVQSMLKRSVDVKDSGNILPGHGGILDRFDAVLFVVPVIFLLEITVFH